MCLEGFTLRVPQQPYPALRQAQEPSVEGYVSSEYHKIISQKSHVACKVFKNFDAS
jgi:hypothetical protein